MIERAHQRRIGCLAPRLENRHGLPRRPGLAEGGLDRPQFALAHQKHGATPPRGKMPQGHRHGGMTARGAGSLRPPEAVHHLGLEAQWLRAARIVGSLEPGKQSPLVLRQSEVTLVQFVEERKQIRADFP